MADYNSNSQVQTFAWSPKTPPVLDQGRPQFAFENETPGANTASQQFCLPANPHGVTKAVSVSIAFAAAPGAFEVDVETVDVDVDANYVVEANGKITSGLNSNNIVRAELEVNARFIRVRNVSNTNGVAMTVTITRHY